MKYFDCIFKLKPVPKGRPRLFHQRVYTPPQTRQYERHIKALMRAERGVRGLMTGPLSVRVECYFEQPKRSTRGYPTRADVDNLAKAHLDAANGVLWADDDQVVMLAVVKHYTELASYSRMVAEALDSWGESYERDQGAGSR